MNELDRSVEERAKLLHARVKELVEGIASDSKKIIEQDPGSSALIKSYVTALRTVVLTIETFLFKELNHELFVDEEN